MQRPAGEHSEVTRPAGIRAAAEAVIDCCRVLASFSETPGATTRTFLSPPMRDVHAHLAAWMSRLGFTVRIDAAGNLRGIYPASSDTAPRLYIGSHLDTVPNAGAFDGILGVVAGIALVELCGGRRLPYSIEVVGFSEEEGVRFGVPFIGSRALVGALDDELLSRCDGSGESVRQAIVNFGLEPNRVGEARAVQPALGYLEFHIEQGPVLESLGLPVGVVDAIAGQSRLEVAFTGAANHAGTTPMVLRRDALAGAAEWIGAVERVARAHAGLVATVGRIEAAPGATNVIPGHCRTSLDVRHADDQVRHQAVAELLGEAERIATARRLEVTHTVRLDHPATPMDGSLIEALETAVASAGLAVHRMTSGAGHDAMILAPHMPAVMLFVRSPRGISHHPDESVSVDDVADLLAAGVELLEQLARKPS